MPKVIDHDLRREQIIDVTWSLIVEGGIEAATMREIAARAGFANGALKYYFPNKSTIVQSTFERAVRAVAMRVSDSRGLAALRTLGLAPLPLDDERIAVGRVLLAYSEVAVSQEAMRTEYAALLGAWRVLILRHLAEGREDGEITTVTPDEVLADELILLTAGANVMAMLGYASVHFVQRQLEEFLARLSR